MRRELAQRRLEDGFPLLLDAQPGGRHLDIRGRGRLAGDGRLLGGGGLSPGPGTNSRSFGGTTDPSLATTRTDTGERSLRRRAIRGGCSEAYRSPHCISASSASPSSRPFLVRWYSNRSGRSL